MSSTPSTSPISLIDRFAWIMKLLIMGLGERKKEAGIVADALVALMHVRLYRLRNAFNQAYARGPIPQRPRRMRGANPITPAENPPTPDPIPAPILPSCFNWLIRMLPGVTGVAVGRQGLIDLLQDPEMLALIAANRAIARTLRPLCHMLGIKPPPALRLPRRPRPAQPATPQSQFEKPRRTHQPRPSPFPIPPKPPTPEGVKHALLTMFGGRDHYRHQDFSPPDFLYIHPR